MLEQDEGLCLFKVLSIIVTIVFEKYEYLRMIIIFIYH